VALSVLDEHIVEHGQAGAPSWVRQQRRHQGLPNYRIVRYADDCAPRTRREGLV
jgi:RNA-directed DNA polymerase